MQQIMQQYSIDATAFGVLSALYYVGYAGMQIPVALLLDRYNPRYTLGLFAFLAAIGTLIFSHADHWLMALAGRFLIGFASAAGFLGASKAISTWFPENRYARMIGFTFTFGLLGALYGGRPLNMMINHSGFANTSNILVLVGVLISLLIVGFYRSSLKISEAENMNTYSFKDLKEIFMQPSLLLIAAVDFLMVGALEGFADVWGVTFLVTSYQIPKDSAAGIISFIYVGMLFGGPALAFLSERLGGPRVIMLCGIGISILFSLMLFSCYALTPFLLQVILFMIGMLCCYQVVVFALSTDYIRLELAGITIAFMNCINMLGGSFFHSVIGVVADKSWDGELINGCRIYSSNAYISALMVIPICALIGSLMILCVKKNKRSVHQKV